MKRWRNVGVVVAMSVAAWMGAMAQASAAPDTGAVKPVGKHVVLEGCLTGLRGEYSLGTLKDGLYRLQGEDKMFAEHQSQQVRVTGVVTKAKQPSQAAGQKQWEPATVKVTKVEKVFDTCQ